MIIGVEWTSANFAAELIDSDGTILGQRQHPTGTTAVKGGAFARVFASLVPPDWLEHAEAVYFSGMVTGRGGWVETGFAPTPASVDDLANAAVALPDQGLPHIFLAGVAAAGELPDVMRGEELKALAAGQGLANAVVVLPGAHTKYVTISDGQIFGLATYMGGEISNLLRKDSLVGRLIPPDGGIDDIGFERGLQMAWRNDLPGTLLRRVFSARSLVLFDHMPASQISGFIAGLLVGAEIAEAEAEWPLRYAPLLVVGDSPEALRYRRAFAARGILARSVTPSTALSFALLHATLSRQARSRC